jgi:eukaryotic-like serine/threonine-protein kinase
MIGRTLAHYTVTAKIGEGGMGEVYRATDTRLKREVALKVLPEAVSTDPKRLARFQREAEAVARLNHPNIVTIHSVEEAEGVHLLTMELVEGQSLDHLLPPEGSSLAELFRIGIPLAEALQAAHEAGIVHRDLKPANVMLTRQNRVKVLDFGLAKTAAEPVQDTDVTQALGAASLTGEGIVVGTVPYMAPEHVRGEALDARSDIFALGIMLYELVTGRRPFAGQTPADIASSILRDTPEPLAQIRAELPGNFQRIVDRCLEKDPKDRFQTALEVSNELRLLQRDLERGKSPEFASPTSEKLASIAVLPFENRSRDEEDEYFSAGLADELLNVLAKIKGFRVSARASSFHFKEKDVPLREIGRALNVATVLDGSVRKAGNRVRIAVQLVKVADGYHLWSETYDRTLEDVFAVQDEIAQAVVKELRTTLLGESPDSDPGGVAKREVAKAARGRATDPEAHRLYLLARHLSDRLTREGLTKAIGYLNEALGRDPNFALAWSELGWAYGREAGYGWCPVAEGYTKAQNAIQRALALEPDLEEAWAHLAWVQIYHSRDWAGAELSIRRALELGPGNPLVLCRAGTLAFDLGRLDEAIGLYRQALELDPLSPLAYNLLGLSLHNSDRNAEAEEAYRKMLELAPDRGAAHAALSRVLLAQGRAQEALVEAKREPAAAFRLWAVAMVHHALNQKAESDEVLQELITKQAQYGAAYQVAQVYAARDEVDPAFEWLERAYDDGDPGLCEIMTATPLRSLHEDARWGGFLEKMGFNP